MKKAMTFVALAAIANAAEWNDDSDDEDHQVAHLPHYLQGIKRSRSDSGDKFQKFGVGKSH